MRVKIEGVAALTYLALRPGETCHMYDTDALTVSRPTLEALVEYLDEQQLTRRRMDVAALFAPNVDPGLAEYLRATEES
jgi:hypothetical protein